MGSFCLSSVVRVIHSSTKNLLQKQRKSSNTVLVNRTEFKFYIINYYYYYYLSVTVSKMSRMTDRKERYNSLNDLTGLAQCLLDRNILIDLRNESSVAGKITSVDG